MIEKNIKELIYFARKFLMLQEDDEVYFTNILLHHFGRTEPYEGLIDFESIQKMDVPDRILNEIASELEKEGKDEAEIERMLAYAMGIISPNPSVINQVFYQFYREKGPDVALSFLKRIGTKNYYYQKTKLAKNITWRGSFKDGPDIALSINLSKPEKSNKDIAKLLSEKSTNYPKCALCLENLGYYGDAKHAPRTNLRYVSLNLAGEKWKLQYSPYGYFENHCIAFKEEHVPMKVDRKTFMRLLDFVTQFPSFFMGSNSDLPIVGGSILNHEHFQGGSPDSLPMFSSGDKEIIYESPKGSKVSLVDYYMSIIRISGYDKEDIIDLGEKILNKWRKYDNEALKILHESDGKQHNTVTSYARNVDGRYELILVLRCNITSEKYPDGVFHAHPKYHVIKKEGIGLIEAAGLFILPARLKRQMEEATKAVNSNMEEEEYEAKYPDLKDFHHVINKMKEEGIDAKTYIQFAAREILFDARVFKRDDDLHLFLVNTLKPESIA